MGAWRSRVGLATLLLAAGILALLAASGSAVSYHRPLGDGLVSLDVTSSPNWPAPADPALKGSGTATIKFTATHYGPHDSGGYRCARVRANVAAPSGATVDLPAMNSGPLPTGLHRANVLAEYNFKLPADAPGGEYTITSKVETVTTVKHWWHGDVCRENEGTVIHTETFTDKIRVVPRAERLELVPLRATSVLVPFERYFSDPWAVGTPYAWDLVFHASHPTPVVIRADNGHEQIVQAQAGENVARFIFGTRLHGDRKSIHFALDPNDRVPETNDDNNGFTATRHNPQLYLTNLRYEPNPPVIGQPVRAWVDVANSAKEAAVDKKILVEFSAGAAAETLPLYSLGAGSTETVGPFVFTPTGAGGERIEAKLGSGYPLDGRYQPLSHTIHPIVGVDGRIADVRFDPEFPALGVEANAIVRIANDGLRDAPAGTLRVSGSPPAERPVPPIPAGQSVEVAIPVRQVATREGTEVRIPDFGFTYDVAQEFDKNNNVAAASPWRRPSWDLKPRVVSPLLEDAGPATIRFEVQNAGAGASPAGTLLEVVPVNLHGAFQADRAKRVAIPAVPAGGSVIVETEWEARWQETLAFHSPAKVDQWVGSGSGNLLGTFRDLELRIAYAPAAPKAGDVLTVTVTLANVGDAVLPRGIPVTLLWHDWQVVEYASKAGIPPNAVETFRVLRTVGADGKVGAMAYARPAFPEGGDGTRNNDAAFGDAGSPPNLRLTIERSANDGWWYAVVRNEGHDLVTSSTIELTLPGARTKPTVDVPPVERGAAVRVALVFPNFNADGDAVAVLRPREPVAAASVLEARFQVPAVDLRGAGFSAKIEGATCKMWVYFHPNAPVAIRVSVGKGAEAAARAPTTTHVLPTGTRGLEVATVGNEETCRIEAFGRVDSATRPSAAEEKRKAEARGAYPAPSGGLAASLLGLAVGAYVQRGGRR